MKMQDMKLQDVKMQDMKIQEVNMQDVKMQDTKIEGRPVLLSLVTSLVLTRLDYGSATDTAEVRKLIHLYQWFTLHRESMMLQDGLVAVFENTTTKDLLVGFQSFLLLSST